MRDCSQWVLCMSESLSACVYVLAELQWPGGNGPAEYPSLTLILLPQASPTPTHGDIYCCLHITTRTEGHLHAYTYRHIWKKLGGKKHLRMCSPDWMLSSHSSYILRRDQRNIQGTDIPVECRYSKTTSPLQWQIPTVCWFIIRAMRPIYRCLRRHFFKIMTKLELLLGWNEIIIC